MKEKKRVVYFDLLRIIAGVLIVMVHVSAQGLEELPFDSAEYFWANFWNGLAFCGVALFVMISGALELSPSHTSDYKRVLRKSGRLFLIYYFWKEIYQIVTVLEQGEPFSQRLFSAETIKEELILALIRERGYYHLWFFLMLAVLFLFVPLIKPAVSDRKVCRYYLIFFFCVAILYPIAFHYEFKFKYLLIDFMERANFYLFTGYLGYFVLGHYLHMCKNVFRPAGQQPTGGCIDLSRIKAKNVKWRYLLYVMALIGMILAGCYGVMASIRTGKAQLFWNDPFTPSVFLASIAIFVGGREIIRRMESGDQIKYHKWTRALHIGAELALGVCLLHPLVINLWNRIGITPDLMPRVISIPLLTIVTVLPAGAVTAGLKKIPLIKKVL